MTGSPKRKDVPPVPEKTYTLEELKKYPPGVDKSRVEEYLHPDEFESVMGVTREEFFTKAPWQREQHKKKAGL